MIHTLLDLLWVWVLAPVLVLWGSYLAGVQYYRGGLWRLFWPIGMFALLLDVLLNFTLFAVLTWDWPREGEWTFSKRLGRLVCGTGWRAAFAELIAAYMLDWADPRGLHVKRRCG